MKTVIIGNSGSGKTWLATRLAAPMSTPVFHLDDLFWEPGGFDKKRTREEIELLVQHSKEGKSWIVEGVFGDLAQLYLHGAGLLVWLDIDWHTCKTRLEARRAGTSTHLHRKQTEEGLRDLVEWASRYYDRKDSRSHEGHKALFEKFSGDKVHLRSESDVETFYSG